MKFLDLKGLQALWTKVLASRTIVETSNESAENAAKIAAVESASEVVGKKYTLSLQNVASNASVDTKVEAAKRALYGTDIPAENPATISGLKSVVDALSTASNVTVEKLATAESGYAASYVVKQNNTQVGATINIPKDFLVRSAELKTATATDSIPNVATGEKYIDFVINTPSDDATASHVYLPINDLVDTYTGENGVAIDASTNKVSAVVDSAANGNEFLTVSATGLKVSGVSTAISTAVNDAKAELIGDSETDTASSDTIEGAKKYADSIVADKNVTATGDSYVSASASNNAVTVAATAATQASLALADSALQGVDTTQKGTNVKVTLGTSVKNVTVAVDETALNTALDGKVDKVEGSSLMTAEEHSKLAAVEASADVNVIEAVKVNGTALPVSAADKSVDIDLTGKADKVTSATSGNFAGLDGNGNLTDSGSKAADFATAAQGTKADTAIQGVTGETAITGGESSYVTVTTSENASHEVTLTSSVKIQAVGSASDSAQGLAEASDVKKYVDDALSAGSVTITEHKESATGTPAAAGTMVVSSVTTENGSVKAVGSIEVESAGAAAAVKTELLGDATATGNTLGKLEDRLETLEGSGSGSIDSRINTAIQALDSDVDVASTASPGHVVTTPASNDGTTSTHVTAATVLTSLTITDGKFSAATSQTIEAIDDTDLAGILVLPNA